MTDEQIKHMVNRFLGCRQQLAEYELRAMMAERERCAKIAEQTEMWNQTREMTDHNDIYTGHYETVKRVTPRWRDGKAIAAAIRGHG